VGSTTLTVRAYLTPGEVFDVGIGSGPQEELPPPDALTETPTQDVGNGSQESGSPSQDAAEVAIPTLPQTATAQDGEEQPSQSGTVMEEDSTVPLEATGTVMEPQQAVEESSTSPSTPVFYRNGKVIEMSHPAAEESPAEILPSEELPDAMEEPDETESQPEDTLQQEVSIPEVTQEPEAIAATRSGLPILPIAAGVLLLVAGGTVWMLMRGSSRRKIQTIQQAHSLATNQMQPGETVEPQESSARLAQALSSMRSEEQQTKQRTDQAPVLPVEPVPSPQQAPQELPPQNPLPPTDSAPQQ